MLDKILNFIYNIAKIKWDFIMSSKIVLELTEQQASSLSLVMEVHTLIGIGNINGLSDLIAKQVIKKKEGDSSRPLSYDECEVIDDKLLEIRSILGHSSSSSFGIGSKEVSESVKSTYEIKKVIDKALVELTGRGHGTTLNDGLTVRYTNQDAPKAFLK